MFKSLGALISKIFSSEPKELIVRISKENQEGLYKTLELAQKVEVAKKEYERKEAIRAKKEAEKETMRLRKEAEKAKRLAEKQAKIDARKAAKQKKAA